MEKAEKYIFINVAYTSIILHKYMATITRISFTNSLTHTHMERHR